MNIRQFAMDNQFIDRILDRIAMISRENKRKYYSDKQIEEQNQQKREEEIRKEEEQEQKRQKENKESKENKEKEDGKEKSKTVKKGTGYASDHTFQNSKWDTLQYHQTKKQQSEQLVNLIKILEIFLQFDPDYQISALMIQKIKESALLCLLESGFRGGSLLEIAKESELFFSYLKIVKVISQHSQLLPCLLILEKNYQPEQKESIYQLLQNLKELAFIFKQCLGNVNGQDNNEDGNTDGNNNLNNQLADNIIETHDMVQSQIKLHQSSIGQLSSAQQIQDVLNMPINIQYKELLKDMRFDYMDMKDKNNSYNHFYASTDK